MIKEIKRDDVTRSSNGTKRIHPYKFTLWVGIASIIMMFAGFTSAYIVRRNMANWTMFDLPLIFWYSTAAILLSSVTMMLAQRSFKNREMAKYRSLLTVTMVLGVLFIIMQVAGFSQLMQKGSPLGKTNSVDYLYVIVGVHALHVVAGVIALIVMFAKAFSSKIKNYNIVPVEVLSTYWHFVDLLWIYLLIFLIAIK